MRASLRRLAVPAVSAAALAGAAWAAPAGINDEMALGSPKARVTVVEYASAACPHCAHFANTQFAQFKSRYIDSGKVRFVQKELLTEPRGFAAAGFMLARCAGKDRYFDVLAAIYRDQAAIYQSGDAKAGLVKIGQEAGGLDEKAVIACVTDQAKLDAMQARINADAERDKIDQVPTFLINGRKYDGDPALAPLSAAVDKALKTAPAPRGK